MKVQKFQKGDIVMITSGIRYHWFDIGYVCEVDESELNILILRGVSRMRDYNIKQRVLTSDIELLQRDNL